MSHFTKGVVNVGVGERWGGECSTIAGDLLDNSFVKGENILSSDK